jgi:DUF1009 family protein
VKRVLGLFAGRGDLPLKIITRCHEVGLPLFLVAFEGQTDPALVHLHKNKGHLPSNNSIWTHFGAVGDILRYLKAHNVTHIVMAGGMQRPSWSDIKLDWKGTQWFAKMGLAKMGLGAAGDDGLLSQIEILLKQEGFDVMSAGDILNDLLAPEGVLGRYEPDQADWRDILRGKEVVHLLGTGDVGQAVVVQEGLVLGVEAIEGTENLLSRCGVLRRGSRGGVLVKMAKPNQTRNIDLPTIGIDTIHQAKAAGLRGIAIEAGTTQILDRDAVIKAADDANLFLIGIHYK